MKGNEMMMIILQARVCLVHYSDRYSDRSTPWLSVTDEISQTCSKTRASNSGSLIFYIPGIYRCIVSLSHWIFWIPSIHHSLYNYNALAWHTLTLYFFHYCTQTIARPTPNDRHLAAHTPTSPSPLHSTRPPLPLPSPTVQLIMSHAPTSHSTLNSIAIGACLGFLITKATPIDSWELQWWVSVKMFVRWPTIWVMCLRSFSAARVLTSSQSFDFILAWQASLYIHPARAVLLRRRRRYCEMM